MKLTFLGTGAADWDINAYIKGQEHRRFSSALIDGSLLIDPGPHIFHFEQNDGAPGMLGGIRIIIVTHTHSDHFNPETVAQLCIGHDCILWGDYACRRRLEAALGKDVASKIPFAETRVNTTYNIGGYSVTPLCSNHATDYDDEVTRIYLIEKDNRILYYGCDSSWIPTTSWNIIKDKKVNVMVIECTCGQTASDDWRIFEHNTLGMLEAMLRMFNKYKLFSPDVRYYTSHMARTLHKSHTELEKYLAPLGVTPAHDGLSIDI